MTRHAILCEISRLDWILESHRLTYAEEQENRAKRLGLEESLAQFYPLDHPYNKIRKG